METAAAGRMDEKGESAASIEEAATAGAAAAGTIPAESRGGGRKGSSTKQKKLPAPAKRKKRLRIGLAVGLPVLLIAAFIGRFALAGSKGLPVNVTEAARGDVEVLINTSGNVVSEEEKVYYAPVSVPVSSIPVTEGQAVKKGDILLAFQDSALAVEKEKATLQAKASNEGYQDNLTKDARVKGDLSEANHNLPIIEQQLTDYTNYLNDLKQRYEDTKNARYQDLKRIEMELTETLRDQELHGASEHSKQYTQDSITANQYYQSTYEQSKDLVEMKREIDATQTIIENLKEDEAEMKSQQSSTETAALTSHGQGQLEANDKLTQLSSAEILENIEAVEGGMKAEFDGVVSQVSVNEGAKPQEGASLLTLQSTSDVKVTVKLSKYDLATVQEGQKADVTIAGNVYEGEVKKVDRMAKENTNGTPVVSADVRIVNPDDAIYLGIEAKVLIHTAKAENVLYLPSEVINTDSTGDFVYVVREDLAVKQPVTTGLASDTATEIKEGVSEGDRVILDLSGNITEGMKVAPVVLQ